MIHPSAIIDPNAELGHNNYIGPFCLIGPNVVMGSGNRLESHVTIGTPAQHRDYFRQAPGHVRIGDNNIMREFVTINAGTVASTKVGNNVSMLIGSHVGHDTVINDCCNLGNNVALGGHSILGVGANLGLATVVHQYRVIGSYAMIGMNSTVTRDIVPFTIAFGSPCEALRLNRVGLQRAGVEAQELSLFEEWFTQLQGKYNGLPMISHEFQKLISQYELDRQAWAAMPVAA